MWTEIAEGVDYAAAKIAGPSMWMPDLADRRRVCLESKASCG
jgi:hypothetical protein